MYKPSVTAQQFLAAIECTGQLSSPPRRIEHLIQRYPHSFRTAPWVDNRKTYFAIMFNNFLLPLFPPRHSSCCPTLLPLVLIIPTIPCCVQHRWSREASCRHGKILQLSCWKSLSLSIIPPVVGTGPVLAVKTHCEAVSLQKSLSWTTSFPPACALDIQGLNASHMSPEYTRETGFEGG